MKQSLLKRSATKHPVLFGGLVVIIFEILMILFSLLAILFAPSFITDNGDFVLQGTVEAFLSLSAIGVAAIFGYGGIWGEGGFGVKTGLAAGAYFIVTYIMSFMVSLYEGVSLGYQWEPIWKVAVFVICVFLIGFCEETFYRGVVANFFYDRYATDSAGVWCATIGSGMIFGLMHITNMVGATDVSYVQGVIVQVVCACAMGMALSAVYFRCRNIWAMIILHAFIDFCGAFSAGAFTGGSLSGTIGSYSPEMCLSALPYVIVTMVLLRPKKMRSILEYRRMCDLQPVTDDIMQSTPKNKRSRNITIAVSAVIVIILVSLATGLYAETEVLNYADSQTVNASEVVTREISDISVNESREYTVTVMSLPESSNAYATFTIREGNRTVFEATYGGRCTDTSSVYLEQGHTYTVYIEYDYTYVIKATSKHTVSFTVN